MKNARTKNPAARDRLIEEPSLKNYNHFFEEYEESGSDVDYIEDFFKGENKKNSKEDDYTNMDEKKKGKQADLLKTKTTRYHHVIPRKKGKMRKLWSRRKWSCYTLGNTSS